MRYLSNDITFYTYEGK